MKRFFAVLWLIFLFIGTANAAPERVALQSAHSSKMVRAGVGSGSLLAAVSPHIKSWETFNLIRLGGDKVALQSVQSGKYVRAGVGTESLLAAVSPHIKSWETFNLIRLGGDKVALQSVQSGKYVRAGVGAESLLAAVSPHIKSWETFHLISLIHSQPQTPPVAGPPTQPGQPGANVACQMGTLTVNPGNEVILKPNDFFDFLVTTFGQGGRYPQLPVSISVAAGHFAGLNKGQFSFSSANVLKAVSDHNGEIEIRYYAPSHIGRYAIQIQAPQLGYRQQPGNPPNMPCFIDVIVDVRKR
jgi:hypothetical protein